MCPWFEDNIFVQDGTRNPGSGPNDYTFEQNRILYYRPGINLDPGSEDATENRGPHDVAAERNR
jgi:hypothetical protein